MALRDYDKHWQYLQKVWLQIGLIYICQFKITEIISSCRNIQEKIRKYVVFFFVRNITFFFMSWFSFDVFYERIVSSSWKLMSYIYGVKPIWKNPYGLAAHCKAKKKKIVALA